MYGECCLWRNWLTRTVPLTPLWKNFVGQVHFLLFEPSGKSHVMAPGAEKVSPESFWVKWARWLGVDYSRRVIEVKLKAPQWYLLLDVDEQVQPARFRDWFLHSGDPEAFDVIQLASSGTASGPLLVHSSVMAQSLLLSRQDRNFFLNPLVFPHQWGVKLRAVHHHDLLPLVTTYQSAAPTSQVGSEAEGEWHGRSFVSDDSDSDLHSESWLSPGGAELDGGPSSPGTQRFLLKVSAPNESPP